MSFLVFQRICKKMALKLQNVCHLLVLLLSAGIYTSKAQQASSQIDSQVSYIDTYLIAFLQSYFIIQIIGRSGHYRRTSALWLPPIPQRPPIQPFAQSWWNPQLPRCQPSRSTSNVPHAPVTCAGLFLGPTSFGPIFHVTHNGNGKYESRNQTLLRNVPNARC